MARRAARVPELVPNQDGAGTIDAVGDGVDPTASASGSGCGRRPGSGPTEPRRSTSSCPRAGGAASRRRVVRPRGSLGIPALTAHRCLTSTKFGPRRLSRCSAGQTVLVAGGAGAVGHAAIQLARWAGARVITTVSSAEKADLARAAGAHTSSTTAPTTRPTSSAAAPDGVDVVVEVAPGANAALDHAVLAANGVVAVYATEGSQLGFRLATDGAQRRYQFVLVYTVPPAVRSGGRGRERGGRGRRAAGGSEAGLPLHRFPLEQTAAAHAAVEGGAVGKVLIDVA